MGAHCPSILPMEGFSKGVSLSNFIVLWVHFTFLKNLKIHFIRLKMHCQTYLTKLLQVRHSYFINFRCIWRCSANNARKWISVICKNTFHCINLYYFCCFWNWCTWWFSCHYTLCIWRSFSVKYFVLI